MKKYFLLPVLFLLASPLFSGEDDLVATENILTLSSSRSESNVPLSDELIKLIIQQIEENKETLEKVNLWHPGNVEEDFFPILQALEKCPKIREIYLNKVSNNTIMGLVFLKLRKNGFSIEPSVEDPEMPKITYSNMIDSIVITKTLIQRLAQFLGCEPVYESTCYLLEDAKKPTLNAFFNKCRAENFYFLSVPEIQKIFEPPFPWAPWEK